MKDYFLAQISSFIQWFYFNIFYFRFIFEMPRNRSRNYALSDQDIIQVLDFDDSDEEGLLKVDNEDLDFLEYESRICTNVTFM